jgi:hypothetical protein
LGLFWDVPKTYRFRDRLGSGFGTVPKAIVWDKVGTFPKLTDLGSGLGRSWGYVGDSPKSGVLGLVWEEVGKFPKHTDLGSGLGLGWRPLGNCIVWDAYGRCLWYAWELPWVLELVIGILSS